MYPISASHIPRSCPRCAGALYLTYDDDYTCLICGEYVYRNPPPPLPEPAPMVQEGPRKRGRPRKRPVAA